MIEYFKQGCKKAMDYWAEYLGVTEPSKSNNMILPIGFSPKKTKFFQPCITITKTTTHFSPPKRRDPSRRWK